MFVRRLPLALCPRATRFQHQVTSGRPIERCMEIRHVLQHLAVLFFESGEVVLCVLEILQRLTVFIFDFEYARMCGMEFLRYLFVFFIEYVIACLRGLEIRRLLVSRVL